MLPPAFILAGGQSSRFGSDKARHPIEGTPMILHVARELATCGWTAPIVVADRAGRFDDLGLRTIGDPTPGLGPMGGLLAALQTVFPTRLPRTPILETHEWRLVVPCDGLGFSSRIADALLQDTLLQASSPDAESPLALGFRADRDHPLPGLYRANTDAVAEVEARLREGRRSLHGLIEDRGRWIAWTDPWPMRNVNRPEDSPSPFQSA